MPSLRQDPAPVVRPIRVALVEDDVLFQQAVAQAMAACDDMTLVAMAGTRTDALAMLRGEPVDVLLVDLGLPDGSGTDVIREALHQWPHCNVMVCTTFGDEAHVMQAIEAGATGYLLKDSEPADMLHEIRSLNGGGSPISPLIARQMLMRFRQSQTGSLAPVPGPEAAVPAPLAGDPAPALSAREKEVLELITKGFTTAEIAPLMGVSHHTVLTFVRRIYAKLNVSSKAEAIYEALHQGLITRV